MTDTLNPVKVRERVEFLFDTYVPMLLEHNPKSALEFVKFMQPPLYPERDEAVSYARAVYAEIGQFASYYDNFGQTEAQIAILLNLKKLWDLSWQDFLTEPTESEDAAKAIIIDKIADGIYAAFTREHQPPRATHPTGALSGQDEQPYI